MNFETLCAAVSGLVGPDALNFETLCAAVSGLVGPDAYFSVYRNYRWSNGTGHEVWWVATILREQDRALVGPDGDTPSEAFECFRAKFEASTRPPDTLRTGVACDPSCGGADCEDCESCDSRCADLRMPDRHGEDGEL